MFVGISRWTSSDLDAKALDRVWLKAVAGVADRA